MALEDIKFEIVAEGGTPAELEGGVPLDQAVATDAGETLVTWRHALQHVQAATYNRYRPSQFRQLMHVDNSLPEWVEQYLYEVIDGYAQWQPGKEDGVTMPGSEVERKEYTFRAYDFFSSYGFTRKQLMTTAKTGLALPAERAKNVMMGAEMQLETIAASGYASLGLVGLTGISGTTSATAVSKTGGGTTWAATSAVNELIADLVTLENKVEEGSKQTSVPDTILLPLEKANLLQSVRNSTTDRTAKELANTALRNVKRIVGWYKLSGEAYCYDSKDAEVLSMIIPVEPRQMGPILLPFGGVRVPVMMSTAGVISKFPTAIAKMTGI